jgi:hypothetical protein
MLATTVTTRSTAALGQAKGVSAALQSTAGRLAHTTHNVGTTLQSLLEQTRNASHFYYG